MAQNYEKVVPSLVSLDVNDEEKRDNYVREMEDALRKYIKTGVKTKQMDEIIETENLFQRRCKEIFDIDRITENILQQITDVARIKENECKSSCEIMEISYSLKEKNFKREHDFIYTRSNRKCVSRGHERCCVFKSHEYDI